MTMTIAQARGHIGGPLWDWVSQSAACEEKDLEALQTALDVLGAISDYQWSIPELHAALALQLEQRVPACASEDEREELLRRIEYHWSLA